MLKYPEGLLTHVSAAGIVAQAQHCADSLGVDLLHQQLDDGLSVCLDQVFALSGEGRGHKVTDLLHCLDYLLLERQVSTKVSYNCSFVINFNVIL